MIAEILALVALRELLNTVLAVLVASLVFYGVVYPLYLSPLAKVPGPLICALTPAMILYKSWSEQRNHYVEELHKRYGPIVRVAPNEIDISDSEYLKDIYVHDFDKGKFYSHFNNYGSLNTFSTPGKKEHRESRKVSAIFYSKSHVCSESVQENVRGVIAKLLGVIDKHQQEPINVFVLWSVMAMDAVNIFTFGKKYCDSVLDDPFGKGREIVKNFYTQSSAWFWVTQLPEFYSLVVPQYVVGANKACRQFIDRQFNQSLSSVGEQESNLVNTLLGSSISKMFDETRAKSECFDHVAAGHNTTATTLSYLYFELARHPEVQDRLINELKRFNGGQFLPTNDYTSQVYKDIEELPFLNAVMYETLRVWSAIPGQEPRIVPPSGMRWRGSDETPPCMIPGGTIVTMQPWSVHRDTKVFTDPNNWNPDRWLTDDNSKLKEMHKSLIAFSAGARMCAGLHLAQSEIRLNVSSIFSRYKVTLLEGEDYDKKSYLTDKYTSAPATGYMPIVFKPLIETVEKSTSDKMPQLASDLVPSMIDMVNAPIAIMA